MSTARRRPRFKRVPICNFHLTYRDLQIIEHVERHRLLNSEQIVALLGEGSPQHVRRRLQLLFHNRYLDRPAVQIADFYRTPGTLPMVYGLGNKGADALADHLGRPRSSGDWASKNRSIRSTFFHHTLMVSSIMVAFEFSCRKHSNVRLIPWEEILETTCPEQTRRKKHPLTWQVRVPEVGSLGVTPDRVFGLQFSDRPSDRNCSYFFLEADRASMPIIRKDLRSTSIFRKLLAYQATATQKLHSELFGINNFRVLTVTRSPKQERVESMVEAAQKLSGPQGVFLFADDESVRTRDVLDLTWKNGRGEFVSLLD